MNQQTPAPVALITGGSVRLGAGIARRLHSEGYSLILQYRNSISAAQALAEELQEDRPDSVLLLSAHLDQADSINTLIQSVLDKNNLFAGRIDTLVNNASAFYATPIGDALPGQWDELVNTNLRAPFLLVQGLAPVLKKYQGTIINITDIHGTKPLVEHSVYSLTKAGLISLTQSLAMELAPDIRTNAISPGAILWPKHEEEDTAYHQKILAQIPLGRLGEIEDIAQTVSFLIANNYINGQVISIDGGKSLS